MTAFSSGVADARGRIPRISPDHSWCSLTGAWRPPEPREFAVQGDELEPGDQCGGDERGGEPGPVDLQRGRRQLADPGVLAGPDAVLDLDVHPVGGVDVGGLAAPAIPAAQVQARTTFGLHREIQT
jgi:hypothetical protein